jgi:hypothetical protein
MNFIDKNNKHFLMFITYLSLAISPIAAQADMQGSENQQVDKLGAKSISPAFSFSIARPDADFTAAGGFVYIVHQSKSGITCTLPPAKDAKGQLIMLIVTPISLWRYQRGIYFKTSDNDHILFSFENRYFAENVYSKNYRWNKRGEICGKSLLLSDGDNWWLMRMRY